MIKQWIIKTFFKDLAMDSFRKAHSDILETMRDDLDVKAEELAKEKLARLLSPVNLDKIVTIDKTRGFVFIGGEKVDEKRLANLKAEAEAIKEFDLWHLMYETPKELAQKAMFVSGEGLADLQKGKSILYTLSTQKNILDIFLSYKKS